VKKQTRLDISLVCTECKSRNYRTTKRRDQRLEIKKFCKVCGKHTLHRETK
jgi:large subunit ribosomal protein L33